MRYEELSKLKKAIEDTKNSVAFEFDKLLAKVDSIGLKHAEIGNQEKIDYSQPPF